MLDFDQLINVRNVTFLGDPVPEALARHAFALIAQGRLHERATGLWRDEDGTWHLATPGQAESMCLVYTFTPEGEWGREYTMHAWEMRDEVQNSVPEVTKMTTHHLTCKWQNTKPSDCEFRLTHEFCPHQQHACDCRMY